MPVRNGKCPREFPSFLRNASRNARLQALNGRLSSAMSIFAERSVMKKLLLALTMSFASAAAFAADNCEEIKAQIDAKIKAVGVPLYKLEVVDVNATTGGKVVGNCDGGKKKIIYWRAK